MTAVAQLTKVLIVDDSVFMRTMIKTAISKQEDMEVVGMAQNGAEAIEKIMKLKPDVVTLDIEMPGVDGMEVLAKILPASRLRVVMVSTLTQNGAESTFKALEKGAMDYVPKPLNKKGSTMEDFHADILVKVRAAAKSLRAGVLGRFRGTSKADVTPVTRTPETNKIVAIGISAGGPATLMKMVPAFPADFPPIVITQHMPAEFTGSFAKRMDAVAKMSVKEAAMNDTLRQGQILLAPGSHHLRVSKQGSRFMAILDDGPKVSGFRPSVDVLFDSVATSCGSAAVGVVMTGMGCDGSEGCKTLKGKGASVFAQDEATSIVYGMPKAAMKTGCIDQIVPLEKIPEVIRKAL